MCRPSLTDEPDLPLELVGYEARTARDVFMPTVPLDAFILMLLESWGYVQKSCIALADGRIVDGWIKDL